MKTIVFKQNGVLKFIRPAKWAVETLGLTIEQIAQKDVPFGLAYKIFNNSELPLKDEYRDAWSIDDSELTDGVGADWGAGSKYQATGWVKNIKTGQVMPVLKEVNEVQ